MNSSTSKTLAVLRGIVREIRLANPKLKPVTGTLAFNYLMREYRCHQVTEKRICKSHEELGFMVQSYLCYLQSLRQSKELVSQYYGKGERSIQETADLVGLKLPDSPEDNPVTKKP